MRQASLLPDVFQSSTEKRHFYSSENDYSLCWSVTLTYPPVESDLAIIDWCFLHGINIFKEPNCEYGIGRTCTHETFTVADLQSAVVATGPRCQNKDAKDFKCILAHLKCRYPLAIWVQATLKAFITATADGLVTICDRLCRISVMYF